MEGLKTKESILKDNLLSTGDSNIKKNVGDRWGQFHREVSTKAIYAGMDEYAKQQCKLFGSFVLSKFWQDLSNDEEDEWVSDCFTHEMKTYSFEEIYVLFLNTLTPKP